MMFSLQLDDADGLPAVGLGTWKSQPNEVGTAVKKAVELGYRHIDCAAIYGNEAEIGAALAECFVAGLVSRDELWITSKLWNDSHGEDDVVPALKRTLADLRLDYLDLYLMHWPVAQRKGVTFPQSARDLISLTELPIAQTWSGMEQCVEQGLCKYIGVSNFSVAKLKTLDETARIAPAVNQIELHPYLQQPRMLEYCRERSIVLTAYSPLGSGDRPGGLIQNDVPELLEDPVVLQISAQRGVSPAQVLLSWAIRRGTAVIPKSVNEGRLLENLAAAEIVLNDEETDNIAALDRNMRYITGSFWALEGSGYTMENLWDD